MTSIPADGPTSAQRFDALYTSTPDPWGFESRFYERRKRALTLASLPCEHFDRVLEIGCSIGVLTADLAPRCGSLLAVDVSSVAINAARIRLSGLPRVRLECREIPGDWPDGKFDMIVISEIGYFLTHAQVTELIECSTRSLSDGGVVLLCHWRHPIEGWELDGDQVHRMFRSSSGLTVLAEHNEEDFRLDLLVTPPAISIARRERLL